MAVRLVDGHLAVVRLELAPGVIPRLMACQKRDYPGAQLVEALGAELIQSDFDEARCFPFVQRVCEWGRGQRHISRIRSRNSDARISRALKDGFLLAMHGKVAEGVECIRRIEQLGQSFASKQLRFLAPTRAVVLDSVLRSRLGYPETTAGYREFLHDCETVLQLAKVSDQLTADERRNLRICDIEAALFAAAKGSS